MRTGAAAGVALTLTLAGCGMGASWKDMGDPKAPADDLTAIQPQDPLEVSSSSPDAEPVGHEVASDRVAARSHSHSKSTVTPDAPVASASPPPDATASPVVEAPATPPPPLVRANGLLEPSVVETIVAATAPERDAELLRALGFTKDEAAVVTIDGATPVSLTPMHFDTAADVGLLVHLASGSAPGASHTHYLAWLKRDGDGLRPIGRRMERVVNACCDGPKKTGDLRIEVVPVHSTDMFDTIIWKDESEHRGDQTPVTATRTVEVVTLEHGKAETIFRTQTSDDNVMIGSVDNGPTPILVVSAAGKAKKTLQFDPKAFVYR